MAITRRRAIRTVGWGTAGLMAFPGSIFSSPAPSLKAPGIVELAALARKTKRGQLFGEMAKVIRAGATPQDLLAAAFLAGVQDIRPRHVGGKLHAVMMVESAYQLAEDCDAKEAYALALWNLDDYKNSQQRDEDEGDWQLSPLPDVRFPNESAARAEFVAAMEAWDSERADRAIVGLMAFRDRDSLFEIMWPFVMRSYIDIGHKAIYGAHIERVVRRIGWDHAAGPIRSLVHALLHHYSGEKWLGPYLSSQQLLPSVKPGDLRGKHVPAESAKILHTMRTANSREAQEMVVEKLKSGLAPQTVWDGLRLYASELFYRRPALLPVHAVTVTNAFGYIWRAASSHQNRVTSILQAAGWLPRLHSDLDSRLSLAKRSIDELKQPAEGKKLTLSGAIERGSAQSVHEFVNGGARQVESYSNELRRLLIHKGFEHHQHKYVAAVVEEAALVDPSWRAKVLAPSLEYIPGADSRNTTTYENAVKSLAKAGIG